MEGNTRRIEADFAASTSVLFSFIFSSTFHGLASKYTFVGKSRETDRHTSTDTHRQSDSQMERQEKTGQHKTEGIDVHGSRNTHTHTQTHTHT